ncbi:C1 family peptidase [Sphingomonas sp. MMS24-JH45]
MTKPMPGFPAALNVDDIKGELYLERPVVFIMAAPQDFMDLTDGRTYQHLQPSAVNRHAMALVGYDDKRQAFRVISWGETWATGYAWVGYDTFRTLATEAYVLEGPGNGGLTVRPELSPAAALDGLVAGGSWEGACAVARGAAGSPGLWAMRPRWPTSDPRRSR